MNKKLNTFEVLKACWMWIFLGTVLLVTICGMIAYQYLRQDPVMVMIKNAQGYVTTQLVYKRPNETIKQVVSKVAPIDEASYECDYDLNQRVNTINEISVAQKVVGTIAVDGTVITFESGAKTVGEVLEENGILLSPVDQVTPDTTEPLSNETNQISVARLTSYTEEKTEILPYASHTEESEEVPYQQVEVIQEGHNGIRTYTEEVVYKDGVEIERHLTSDQRTEPVDEILKIGTNLTIGKPQIEVSDIPAWRPYVVKALEMNGLEPTEDRINRVLRQIQTESDGDQDANQEIIDMNTLIGQNAQGLMQTIPMTFNYYHFKGYDDIHNGFHNLLAAINSAKERYGDDLIGLGEGHGY